MALLFMDGFDGFSTLAQANRRKLFCSGSIAINQSGGRWGGTAIQCYNGEAKGYINLETADDTMHIGFGFKQSQSTGNLRFSLARGTLGYVQGAGAYTCFNLYQQNGQQVDVYDAAGTKLGFYAMPLDGVWHWWDISVVALAGTNGSIEVRMDGAVVFSATGVNMAGASATGSVWTFGFGYGYGYNADANGLMDDLVVCDSTGTHNNTVIGDCRIVTRHPTSLDSASGFVANTGTIPEAIDDPADDDDTTYISSSTLGDEFFVGFDNMSVVPSSIKGVKVTLIAKKTGAETTGIIPKIKSNGVSGAGNEGYLASGYGGIDFISEVDPNTGSPWTLAAANAAKLGGTIA